MPVDLHVIAGGGVDHDTVTGLDRSVVTAVNDKVQMVYRDFDLASLPINNCGRNLIGWVIVAAAAASLVGVNNLDKNIRRKERSSASRFRWTAALRGSR